MKEKNNFAFKIEKFVNEVISFKIKKFNILLNFEKNSFPFSLMAVMNEFHFTSTKENLGNKRLLISQVEIKFLDNSANMLRLPEKYLRKQANFSKKLSKQAISEHYDKVVTFSLTSKWNVLINALDLIFVFEKKQVQVAQADSPKAIRSQYLREPLQVDARFESESFLTTESKDDLVGDLSTRTKANQSAGNEPEPGLQFSRIKLSISNVKVDLDEKAFKYISFVCNYCELFRTLSEIKRRKKFDFEIKKDQAMEKQVKQYFLRKKLEKFFFKHHRIYGTLTREICLIKIYKEIYPVRVLHIFEKNIKSKDFLFAEDKLFKLTKSVEEIMRRNLKGVSFRVTRTMPIRHLFEILNHIEQNEFDVALIGIVRDFVCTLLQNIDFMNELFEAQIALNSKQSGILYKGFNTVASTINFGQFRRQKTASKSKDCIVLYQSEPNSRLHKVPELEAHCLVECQDQAELRATRAEADTELADSGQSAARRVFAEQQEVSQNAAACSASVRRRDALRLRARAQLHL